MLRFVWLHELYHCLNGHTGYLAVQGLPLALDEMPEPGIGLVTSATPVELKMRRRMLRLMELDADRTAFWALCGMQEIDYEPIAAFAVWPRPRRLKLAFLAAVLMTFFFDQAARRRIGAGPTHPYAYHRLHNLIRTAASNLARPDGEMKQAFAAVVVELERLGESVPALFRAARRVKDLRAGGLQRRIDAMEAALTAARARIAPFAFHCVRHH